jgi:hypothetical protein
MLINLTNHPSKKWTTQQITVAKQLFGTIADIDFPAINPNATSSEIDEIAHEYFTKTVAYFDQCANTTHTNAVHIQGEFTFVFRLVTMLKTSGISCVASTSNRKVELVEGKKVVEFNFIQFREY